MNRRVHFDIQFYFQLHGINEKAPLHIYCAESFSLDFVKIGQKRNHYILDVLWGQPVKLVQVASTSELLENQRNDLVFFKIILFMPSHFCRASEASKIMYEKFGPKILIPH